MQLARKPQKHNAREADERCGYQGITLIPLEGDNIVPGTREKKLACTEGGSVAQSDVNQ